MLPNVPELAYNGQVLLQVWNSLFVQPGTAAQLKIKS